MKTLFSLGRLMAFAIIVASASSAFGRTSWLQYGFDATHTSDNSNETILTRANVSKLTFRWGTDLVISVPSAPIVGQGMVFFAADGNIVAVDARTGIQIWSHLSCSGTDTVQPALGKHGLFVGDGGGDLAAYDPVTGTQRWCEDESGSITSAPATNEDTVYLTNGSDVVAVDQGSGAQRWRFTPNDFSPVTSTPAIAHLMVYVTGGSSVFALDEKTGEQIWRNDLSNESGLSAVSVSDTIVYIGGVSGLYALSRFSGDIGWANLDVGILSTPAVANNLVYVNGQDPNFGLFAFDALSGALVWQRQKPGEPLSTVTIANGVLYDVAENGAVMMFNSDTGAFLGKFADPESRPFYPFIGAQAAVVNGTVYVSTGDFAGTNRVDAFHLP